MKVTLLGHASVLVAMEGATCVMDPVFFDPFEEGAVTSCPRRRVFPAKLPPIDTVIVSHRHPDHFDLPSLARLPRDADVIVPGDALLVYALDRLGFRRIHPVAPMAPILSDRFELYPTRSEAAVREFGMVFRDSAGVFWNQVDSPLAPATIATVKERFGAVDLLFAMYASQNFDYFDGAAAGFPYETHRQNLASALAIEPRAVAPAAAGFRFCGAHAWLNAFLFPIGRERFVADLKQLGFAGEALVMNPGDEFAIAAGRVEHRPGASSVAVMDEDDSAAIAFDPTAPVPPLVDPNPEGASVAALRQTLDPFVAGLTAYAQDGGNTDKLVPMYRRRGASYALAVVFPDGAWDHVRFEFHAEGARVTRGAAAGDVVHRIAASALAAWIEHRKNLFYVRAYSRRHQAVYDVTDGPDGAGVRPRPLPDLLMHYVLNVMPGSERAAKTLVDRQLAALGKG
jgi:hypothetical protein